MRKSLIEEKVQAYTEGIETIRKHYFGHPNGIKTCEDISDLTDDILIDSFDRFEKALDQPLTVPMTLVALGGYGRRQLNPFSDVDIIIVVEKNLPPNDKAFVEQFISFLWDVKFKVGSSCRSIEDCVKYCSEDVTIKTSFLEARYLNGDKELFKKLQRTLHQRVFSHKKKAFFQQKIDEREVKSKKFGNTIKSSSPNLKEAIGGLRDYHMILWIARCFWDVEKGEELKTLLSLPSLEKDALDNAVDLLLNIRTCLHFMFNKSVDDLNPESQRNIAITLYYKDTMSIPAEMKFMKDYYRAAITVNDLMLTMTRRTQRSLNKLPDFINRILIKKLRPPFKQSNNKVFLDEQDFDMLRENPMILFDLPKILEKEKLEMTVGLILLSRRIFQEINPTTISGSFKINYLLKLLKAPDSCEKLRVLEQIGALPALIKGFREIENLVYHDVYHSFTVDEHTLQAVKHLEDLPATTDSERKILREVYANIKKPELLKLGLLFHDIGKTYGRTHVARGLKILEANQKSWQADIYIFKTVHFLIKQHLVLSMTAQRRDIYDANTIKAFLKKIPNREYLDMLFLLTYADMSAVTQGFLNSWKLNLLEQLYKTSAEAMEVKISVSRIEIQKRLTNKLIRETIIHIKEKGGDVRQRKPLLNFLSEMPMSYLNSAMPTKVLGDMALLNKLEVEPISVSLVNRRSVPYSEITVCSHDKRGLFNMIAATLVNNGINVNGANICSSSGSSKWVIDTFLVDTIENSAKVNSRLVKKISSDLSKLIQGKASKEKLFATRKKYIKIKDFHNVTSPTIIKIDNTTSDEFTILEVIMEDLPGVLYVLSKILYQMGVDINSCYLAIEGNRAVDTFYITRDNHKIYEKGFDSRLRIKLASVHE